MTTTQWPTSLQGGGAKFKKRVDNPRVFRTYMMAKMPTLGVTNAHLESIDVASSRVVLPFSWRTKDLFGRLSVAALTAAAETASVSLLVLNIRNQNASLKPVLKTMSMETLIEDVQEDVWLVCEEPEHYAEMVHAGTTQTDVEMTVSVRARTYAAQVTHRFEFTWILRRS